MVQTETDRERERERERERKRENERERERTGEKERERERKNGRERERTGEREREWERENGRERENKRDYNKGVRREGSAASRAATPSWERFRQLHSMREEREIQEERSIILSSFTNEHRLRFKEEREGERDANNSMALPVSMLQPFRSITDARGKARRSLSRRLSVRDE